MINMNAYDKMTRPMNSVGINTVNGRVCAGSRSRLVVAMPLFSTAADQKTFATPEAAVDALLVALKANDEAALLSIFGDQHRNLVDTGDRAQDTAGARAPPNCWQPTACWRSGAPTGACC